MKHTYVSAMLMTGMVLAAKAVTDGGVVPGAYAGNAQRRNGHGYGGDFAKGYLSSSCCAFVDGSDNDMW
jgi:hypothetical protein